jgi:hypothetical protein
MNYTKPNDPNHQDSPQDWLNTSIIFTRALSLLLKDTEGIIVNITGDVKLFDETVKMVAVYKEHDMIHIIPCDEEKNLIEGTLVWMTPISKN